MSMKNKNQKLSCVQKDSDVSISTKMAYVVPQLNWRLKLEQAIKGKTVNWGGEGYEQ